MVDMKNRSEFIKDVNSLGSIQEKNEIIIKNEYNKQIAWISQEEENCFWIQFKWIIILKCLKHF